MKRAIGLILAWAFVAASQAAATSGPTLPTTLQNGFVYYLSENRANPVISATVIVKAGSVREKPEVNGISHLLEHLLFNGTGRRGREQIYGEMARLGIFEHASTGKDYTIFTFVFPKRHLEPALDLLSDMLINSIIPEEALEKEKGIVVEEMRGRRANPDALLDEALDRALFQDSPYALPVLGNESIVSSITRDEIVRYYRGHYLPSNMVGLFIGDFDPEEMGKALARFFGRPGPATGTPPALGPPEVERRSIRSHEARTAITRVALAFPGPGIGDPELPAFLLLSQLLAGSDTSLLRRAWVERVPPLATLVSGQVQILGAFSVLKIEATLAPQSSSEELLRELDRLLPIVSQSPPPARELHTAANSMLLERLRLEEQFHYNAYFNAPYYASAETSHLASFEGRVLAVTPAQLQRVAARYLEPLKYVAVVQKPANPDRLGTKRETRLLPNGLTLIVEENPFSKVAAVHILAKDRALMEPPARGGIAEFLMRLLPRGSRTASGPPFAEQLRELGARLKVTDDPTIPFDDYSYSPRFAEIRLEVGTPQLLPAMALLKQMVSIQAFQPDQIEAVRRETLAVIALRNENLRAVAEDRLRQEMFGDHPHARPIIGTPETVAAISPNDLASFHKRFLAPSNLIVSVVSSMPAAKVADDSQAIWEQMEREEVVPPVRSEPAPSAGKEVRIELNRGQSYIAGGRVIKGINLQDRLAIHLATALLSGRLQESLREREGLAYTVGASVEFDSGWGAIIIRIGTRPQNLERARTGIIREIRRLRALKVSREELEALVSAREGRLLVRLMTSINQGYYLSLSQYEWGDPEAFKGELRKARAITVEEVGRAIEENVVEDGYTWVVAR